MVHVSAGIDTTAGIPITFVDAVGKIVFKTTTYQTDFRQLHLKDLASGIYYVRISGKDGILIRRVAVPRE